VIVVAIVTVKAIATSSEKILSDNSAASIERVKAVKVATMGTGTPRLKTAFRYIPKMAPPRTEWVMVRAKRVLLDNTRGRLMAPTRTPPATANM